MFIHKGYTFTENPGEEFLEKLPDLSQGGEISIPLYARACTALTAIDAPNCEWLDASACTALTAIDAPNCKTLYASACTALTAIYAPNCANPEIIGTKIAGSISLPEIPKIDHADARILAAIEKGGRCEMNSWHTCGTTHCRAGWLIHLAGEAGYALEGVVGSLAAGCLLYQKARPHMKIPNFFASNESALADIRECAAKDPLPISTK